LENGLADVYRTGTVTGRTSRCGRTGFCAAAVADIAFFVGWDVDAFFDAFGGIFQCDFDADLQIRALIVWLTAAAPASVDPATATFTCPGVPEASVQAIIGYVLLFPDTSTDPQDGSIRHLECRGKMYTDNAWTGTLVFYSQFGRELHGYHPWQLSRLPHGRRSEAFDVPGVEGATGEFRIPDEEGGPSALITCGDSFVLLAFSNQTPLNGDVKAGIINPAVVEGDYEQIRDLAGRLSVSLPDDWFPTLLRLPDVIKNETVEVDEAEWQKVYQAIADALAHLIEFRQQEGRMLQKLFEQKIATIGELLKEVEPYEQDRIDKIKGRLLENLQKVPEVEYDKNRFEQELIYYLEKLDINEEKDRLRNHLHYFIDTMNNGSGQGKKLGFIVQEIGREINTLGSKSNHAEMQQIVVQMKDVLEQIKEQVLNVL